MTTTPQRDAQVLIAGAGPTGLVLALWLTRQGIRVRIIDPVMEPGTTSRALVVQARTLEFYHQIGIADALVERAIEFVAVNLWVLGHKAARVEIGSIGTGLSPYPSPTVFPQDEHERLLIERLSAAGVTVERGTTLAGYDDSADRVRARLTRADGSTESCEVAYLAGCDGARSTVRAMFDTTFAGGTYERLFYVADVEATGVVTNGELHLALDNADFLAVFPMKGAGHARVIGTVLSDVSADGTPLTWADVSKGIVDRMQLDVEQVHWFSTYRVHHRVAGQFRRGRAFLLGDAAHIHSPVGGQGMNTGIGDAVNLGWKLAAVLQGRADPQLLDSYQPERIAFARQLVETTDRAFSLVTSDGPIARWVRLHVVPRVLPPLTALTAVRRLMFRTVSQIAIRYRTSTLSIGRAGGVHGGDRLPWVAPDGDARTAADNFVPLTSMDWQVHIYGDATPGISATCAARALPLYVFPWRPAMQRDGLERGALYLVRPDGYVALADGAASPATLERYLDDRGLRLARTG
jgi:2-polyprenyl-6-methoxyphenol hydroxylase-like FAD-dependent oxidoreductase